MSRNDYAERTGFSREPPFTIGAAQDCFIENDVGERFLDLTSGWNVTNAGWNNPDIRDQWLSTGATNPFRPSWCDERQLDALKERLASIAPGRRVIPSCTGSEAVDNALKFGRMVTGRPGVICFEGAYHGSGTGASLATGYHVPHLEALSLEGLTCELPLPSEPGAIERAEEAIRRFENGGTLIFETVLTNMACRAVPIAYREMLVRVCSELGIVLVCDEIGTGFNRLGSFFSSLGGGMTGRTESEPDIVVSAKALTNGLYPLSLCLVRESLARQVDGAHFTSTYAAMPSGCAAAVATIDAHLALGLGANAIAGGQSFRAALTEHVLSIDGVRSLEGEGLELALHLDWRSLRRRGLTPFSLLQRLRETGYFATLSPGEDHLMLTPVLTTPPKLLIGAAKAIGEALTPQT